VTCLWMKDRGGIHKEIKTFGTMTTDLLAFYDWLHAKEVTHVLMERTGIFWKSTYNLLEDNFQVLFVNAAHIKRVPGRKTNVMDCESVGDPLTHPGWDLQPVFWVYQRLGGKEDPETSDACGATKWFQLEKVE
jgi:hypothetical protein